MIKTTKDVLIEYFHYEKTKVNKYVPINGTASDVVGIDSATRFRKTVSDSKMVTPAHSVQCMKTLIYIYIRAYYVSILLLRFPRIFYS